MPDEIKDQIDAMLNIGESTEEESDDLSVEEEEKKETSETIEEEKEEKEEDEEKKEEKSGEESKEEKKEEEEVKEEEKESSKTSEDGELETVKKENKALRLRLNEASEKKIPEIDKKTPDNEKKIPEPETKVETVEEITFLDKDVDLDELMRSPDMFNKLLNKVYKMGADASKTFQETTLKNIPDIVKSNVLAQATLKKKVDEFYEDNKDLKSFKKAVAAVYEEIAAENPDWELDKTFEETEKETRKRLELHKEAEEPSSKKDEETHDKRPKFPKTKSSRSRQKPNTSHLLSEIDKMNESL